MASALAGMKHHGGDVRTIMDEERSSPMRSPDLKHSQASPSSRAPLMMNMPGDLSITELENP